MVYKVHYEARRRDKSKVSGTRYIKAPNPGTAEDRLIRQLKKEGKASIIIIGVQLDA